MTKCICWWMRELEQREDGYVGSGGERECGGEDG